MTPYEFAIEIVKRLQAAGFQALFAGGCVRDELMGKPPKDYDVATNARPDEVRQLFGVQRTLAIGASFGVISVLGPKSAGQIDVATFRRDLGYSDGRHPDAIAFADAREDAQRRDFTINGLFFDPIAQQVLDFVGGKADLEERVVRAIGDPHQRIDEDKLRMLRAVRFAATLNFEIDEQTKAAVREHAAEIKIVSGERIGAEMRRMLTHATRHVAARLLVECDLLQNIVAGGERETSNRANWRSRLKWLEELGEKTRFETALVLLLAQTIKEEGIEPVAEQWKLSAAERKSCEWIHDHWLTLTRAAHLPWSQIQPLLIHADAEAALQIAETTMGPLHVGVEFCRKRLSWPKEKLDPPAFLNGSDLQALGLTPGPVFAKILSQIRDEQLDGLLNSRADAEKKALELAGQIP
ncbi:MAG: CCA tRNA nucleotidyltransferase [Pirellulaceae bacterium]